jgi:hypothetical protein
MFDGQILEFHFPEQTNEMFQSINKCIFVQRPHFRILFSRTTNRNIPIDQLMYFFIEIIIIDQPHRLLARPSSKAKF